MLPMTGHTANIEEPALFNLHVAEFLAAVENGALGHVEGGEAGRSPERERFVASANTSTCEAGLSARSGRPHQPLQSERSIQMSARGLSL